MPLGHKTKTEITSIVTNSIKALEVVHIKKIILEKNLGKGAHLWMQGRLQKGVELELGL